MTVDADVTAGNDTSAVSVVDSGVGVQGLRTHQDILEAFRTHHLQMKRNSPRARSVAELKRLAENRKDDL